MEFFLQSPLKMADIFPGLMMVTHGAWISNCGLLARWLKDSPTSPLPIQLRTNSHPDWFRVSPDLITIAQWTPHVVSTFLMYWTRNRTAYEHDMARAAAHASDAYRSQSLQLHAAYQVSQDQPSPVETHNANGFSNYMRALEKVSSTSSTKGGDAGTHPKNAAQATEGTSPSHAQDQVPVAATPPKVKAELVQTVCDHKELHSPNQKPDTMAHDHHGTKRTPSIRSSSQSGRSKHKKQKHKRPQVPHRFVPEPPKTYVDGKLITPTNDFGPSDLSDSGSSTHHRRHKSRPHRRRSHRKHGHHGGSGGSGSGSSDVGLSSSSSGSLLNQSWDYDDFFDKDGIWKPPKDHPHAEDTIGEAPETSHIDKMGWQSDHISR
jgi:uncharacterized membrane protein YgcG